MKKTKLLVFGAVITVCSFLGLSAAANDYDFIKEVSFTGENAEEKAQAELEAQLNEVKKLEETLDDCTYLEILEDESGIFTKEEELTEEVVETNEEKEEVVSKYENEGYVVNSTTKDDVVTTTNYSFSVLNGKVTGAVIDGVETEEYNGKNIKNVLATFTSYSTDDVRVEVGEAKIVTNPIVVTDAKEVTKDAAIKEVERLQGLGFADANYKQNNTVKTEDTFVYTEEKNDEQITSEILGKNEDKEVLDVVISDATEIVKDEFTSEKFDNETSALEEKNSLASRYDYVSDVKIETIIEEEDITEKTGEEEVSSKNEVDSVDFDVTTDGVIIENADGKGYKKYYLVKDVEVESAKYVNIPNYETEAACNAERDKYIADGYTATCIPVESTTVESATNNTYNFNDTKESTTKRFSHLDISANNTIDIIDEKGETVATVTGTLSNVSGSFVRNGETINLVYPSNVSSDGGRLEFCQSNSTDGHCGGWGNSSGNFYVTNQDLVTIKATITYNYNGEKTKDITLVGYLKDSLNECRQDTSFDFELDFKVDKEGNIILNIGSDTTWTLNADKEAVIEDKIYYDEYQYTYTTETVEKEINKYYVEAHNIDYSYDVSYVATDYTISYSGSEETYTFDVTNTDIDHVINGNKTTYTVITKAVIKEKDTCGIGEEVEPPHTEASIRTFAYNMDSFVLNVEDKKRKRK